MFIEIEWIVTLVLLLAFIVYLAHKVGESQGELKELRRNPDFVKGEEIKKKMREEGKDPYDSNLFAEEWKKAKR